MSNPVKSAGPRVLRIFRARVEQGREAEWERFGVQPVKDQLAQQPGLLASYGGWTTDGEVREYINVSVWIDLDAMRQFSGASGGPVLSHGGRDIAETVSVEHVELRE